jgi:hypothetical protein
LLLGIEINEIAGSYTDRADAEPLAAIIQKIEIDKPFERKIEAALVNKARPLFAGFPEDQGEAYVTIL